MIRRRMNKLKKILCCQKPSSEMPERRLNTDLFEDGKRLLGTNEEINSDKI